MSLSQCKISKRVQNVVNAALGKMGKTSLREQKGRLQQKQLAVVSSWIGGCSLLSKSLKAKLKQDDGCDDDDADLAAAANRLIMLVNPIVPLALALTFNNSQKIKPRKSKRAWMVYVLDRGTNFWVLLKRCFVLHPQL